MKEKPILFSGPMVRAILDGRKTVTRRIVKPQPDDTYRTVTDGVLMYADECGDWHPERCPYGQPGDRLWVRETHFIECDGKGLCYRADGEFLEGSELRWRPSIFMPRWASRITLEIVSVRVERLREITEADAIAEGVAPFDAAPLTPEPKAEFARLWNEINTNRGFAWDANPWVWRIEFRRVTP